VERLTLSATGAVQRACHLSASALATGERNPNLLVKVHHIDLETGRLTHVADVACACTPHDEGQANDPNREPRLEALEYAWERTQNLGGSWSKGLRFEDGGANLDFSPDVTVVAPLPVEDGRTYGLRSSMVGDVFEIGGQRWAVANIGFQEIV
jgi:hypothetical protein